MAVYIYVGPTLTRPTTYRTRSLKPTNPDSFCCLECCQSLKENKLQCDCGEDRKFYEWSWESQREPHNAVISNDNREVLFHPVYSSGTAAVRGQKPFKKNLHYYWEVKMLTNLYGTDVMVGVGTSKVVFSDWQLRFCSLLGCDSESWGYSYHGTIQHNRLSRKYGPQFGLGSLVGVHLDMCAGTLEYYLNRKPLGIAFRGLKNYELYPMVCSTAAQSAMRVSCSLSEVPTLQLKSLQTIVKYPNIFEKYQGIPGLVKMIDSKYFWLVPRTEKKEESHKTKLALEDEVVLSTSFDENRRQRKRLRTIRWSPCDVRSDPDHVTYRSHLNDIQNEYRGDVSYSSMSSSSLRDNSVSVCLKSDVRESTSYGTSEKDKKAESNESSGDKSNTVMSNEIYGFMNDTSDAESETTENDGNYCTKCNFYLGKNCTDTLCAYCDVII